MKVGDLVKPLTSCGGLLGRIRCETAVVLAVNTVSRHTEVDMHVYEDIEFDEYEVVCACGTLLSLEHELELISESR